jgi:DNA-binding response OmpR family regulator
MSSTSTTTSAATRHDGVVVIVEDDANIISALKLTLQVKHMASTAYSSAEAMLDDMEVRDERIWVPVDGQKVPMIFGLIDLNLPNLNGFALATQLRAHAPALPMAIMTASLEGDRVFQGPIPDGVPCLTKPFRFQELEALLNKLP